MRIVETSASHDQFAELFVQHQRRIYTYIATLLAAREDVEDVFQQTCVILWKKWQQFTPDADFASWGCGIARNEVRNFLRRRHSRLVVHFREELLEELSDEYLAFDRHYEDRRQALSECLEKLPRQQQTLIENCYRGEAPIREIAERMGISSAALYMKLHRIRRILLDCIHLVLNDDTAE